MILAALLLLAQQPTPTSLLPGDVVLPGVTATPEPSHDQPHLQFLSVIVIDPGHGGDDAGVKNAATTEKDLTLAIAKAIESKIEAQTGAHVLLTRSGDVRVEDADRAALANESRAGLFVSIHVNSSPSPAAHGFQVYYHDAYALEARAGDVKAVPWNLAQRGVESDSAKLAETLRASLAAKLTLADRGVRRMPLATLEGVTCPAAMIEIGFLSNADEALALSTDAVQDAIAEAVADAVVKIDAELAPNTP